MGTYRPVDHVFLSGTVEELKLVLRDYWKLHIIAIREFNSIDHLAFNLPKARREMTEKRIRA